MKQYGSTTKDASGDDTDDGPSYLTPYHNNTPAGPQDMPVPSAFPRAQSVNSAQSNETEPLLGETLLPPSYDQRKQSQSRDKTIFIHDPKSLFLSPIHTTRGSDYFSNAGDTAAATVNHDISPVRPIISPPKRLIPRSTPSSPWNSMFGSNSNSSTDPRIGYNIFANSNANDVSGTELDTLAYSASLRDHDESTLFSSDAFLRKYGLSDGSSSGNTDKGGEGWSIRVSTKSLLLCVGLAVGIFLASIASIGYTEEDAHIQITSHDKISTGNTSYKHYDVPFVVPYEKVDRESFGDPISNFIDVALFHPSLLYRGKDTLHGHVGWFQRIFRRKQEGDSREFHNNNNRRRRRLTKDEPKPFLRVPFPTGAFWTNLVMLPRTAKASLPILESNSGIYSYPIVAYPYSFQWSSLGKLQVSYSASRRLVEPKMIHDEFAPDITIGSVEEIGTRNIVQFDSLSVTLRFYESDSTRDSNLWETYIVQGSPYITILYSGLTPALRALSDFNEITCPLHEGDSAQTDDLVSSYSSASSATEAKTMGICDIAINSSRQKKVITGVQFVVTTKEGLTWLIFASEPITFEFDQDKKRTIQSTEKYNGVIRLALVPPSSKENEAVSANDDSTTMKLSSSSGVKRLIYHSSAYPIGGTVSWDFRSGTKAPLASSTSKNKVHRRMVTNTPKESNIATISFTFDTHHMTASSPSTNVQLLMLALPHHAISISSADELLLRPDDFDLYYHCIKGRLVPIVGNTWSYEEELTSVGFGNDPKPVSTSAANRRSLIQEPLAISALDQSIRDLILKTVQSDLKINLPDLNGGAYSFGKQIARLAQLAHIAEVVDAANLRIIDAEVHSIKNITTKDTNQSPDVVGGIVVGSSETKSGTTRRAYALLEKYLTMWLGDDFGQSLVYDAQLGGILSKVGTADINADFGNSRFNDHHFHYGYVLYASAILGRAKPEFISQYGPHIDAIFYDVANNGNANDEIFFPFARHKSWFDGHSFASGLFPFADGKSQESSSEAVNCYYGAFLYSRVRWGDRKIVDYTRLLLATEITGAKTYWHMTPPTNNTLATTTRSVLSVPYTPEFQANFMVGNLGMTDVTSTTWFGTDNIFVHLINFMPVSPITSELFDKGE